LINPALLIVDDDPQVLAAVRRDLRSRYREHYTVMSAASGEEALGTIRELKTRGDSLAMIISDQRMPGMLGGEVLARSRDVYPLARRVLLTAYSDIEAAVRAINEAHLDHYLSKPWFPPEENLFPVIDDLLDAWQAEYLPEAKGLRLVGHQWSPRSHAIKNFLASNLIPYRWLDVTRDPDACVLLDAAGVRADELPALFFDDGSPALRNPEPRQVSERLGRSLLAAFDVYDLVIVGAGSGWPRGGRLRRIGRAADPAARPACARRAGGQQFPDRELSWVSGWRQRQRVDTPRSDAGAAAWGRVYRSA
jgi:thioredoxin reductase (NADPH)